jgi:arylsulfatase
VTPRAFLVPALCTVALAACSPSGPASPQRVSVRWQDLLVDPSAHTRAYDETTGVHFCADQTLWGVALAPGERREYRAEAGGGDELRLAVCREGGEGAAALGVELASADGAFTASGAASLTRRLELPAGWSETSIDLAGARGRVELALAPELPAGAKLFVRDLAIRTVLPAPAPRPAPRAILISLDAFREDAWGGIGGRTKTPALDRVLAEAERFHPHWAAEISTKPSHASMLTGLPAEVHGCDRGDVPLSDDIVTMPERLRSAGVATAGFASVAPFFAEKFGLAQGFDRWRLEAWTTAQELRAAATWLDSKRDEPSFLFVHLYAPHSDFQGLPYEAEGVTRATVFERFGVADYGCRAGRCGSAVLLEANFGLPRLPREAEIARFLYERGIETLDSDLAEFLDDLRRSGLWDEALVIVTADHGEAFDEHGFLMHTTAHEEVLRVPLVVKWPQGARAGRATERFSTALDLAPTLLAHFGLEAPDLTGRDLERPAAADEPRLLVSKDAVRLGDVKHLLPTSEFPAALYDLAADPGERSDLLPGAAAEAERLAGVRARAIERARALLGRELTTRPAPYTPEEIERLRSLGYLR